MFFYRMYGLKLCSELDFFQLVKEEKCSGTAEEIWITEGVDTAECEEQKKTTGKNYEIGEKRSWLENRTLWLQVEEGKRIRYRKKEGANELYVRTYILGFGMAMLAFQRGMLAIHCSAVSKNGKAVLIAGESGAGKSTVTSAFLEAGYSLMADDMAFVEKTESGMQVWPAFPFQKMCRDQIEQKEFCEDELFYIDEQKDKYMVPYKGDFSVEAVPLSGLLYLCQKDEGKMEVQPVDGLQKLYACANNLFLRHLLGNDKYTPFIGEKCLQMAGAIKISCLLRAFSESTPEETAQKALEIVQNWEE